MAKKKKKNDADEELGEDEESSGKGGKLKLIGGAVVLLVGGMFVGSQVLGTSAAAPVDPNAPTTTTTLPPGDIVTLEPFTLNLADGRFLKVGLAFELAYESTYPDVEVLEDDTTKGFTREVDIAISTMGGYTFEELVAPGGKDLLKEDLLAKLIVVSEENIADLYFTEFVMQ